MKKKDVLKAGVLGMLVAGVPCMESVTTPAAEILNILIKSPLLRNKRQEQALLP